MKIKVAEAEGLQLNLLVAMAEGHKPVHNPTLNGSVRYGWYDSAIGYQIKNYSGDPALAQMIIEREHISLSSFVGCAWRASIRPQFANPHSIQYGETAREAAMRCFVASKLGDEVEVPEEPR